MKNFHVVIVHGGANIFVCLKACRPSSTIIFLHSTNHIAKLNPSMSGLGKQQMKTNEGQGECQAIDTVPGAVAPLKAHCVSYP